MRCCRSSPALGTFGATDYDAAVGNDPPLHGRDEHCECSDGYSLLRCWRPPWQRGHRLRRSTSSAVSALKMAARSLAVAAVLYNPKCGWRHSAFDLVTIIRSKPATGWSQPIIARMKSAGGNRSALWKAVAEAWVRVADRRSA